MPRRPGARVASSPRRVAEEKDARARELERRLLALEKERKGGASSAAAAASSSAPSVRAQLCELLADAILTDPSYAAQRRAPDRLWRQCFYPRVARLRSKAQKAALAASKRGAALPSGSANASNAEGHLAAFLGEAVTLYEYLVDKLREKLLLLVADAAAAPPGASSSAFAAANVSGDDDSEGEDDHRAAAAAAAGAGVVECLHRLLVCLGDLRRYSSNGAAAEACYLLSSRLGPGIGHPANQLGVLCQSRIDGGSSSSGSGSSNQSAAGLYWYARALLASDEPFETASVNLVRLLEANQRWLDGRRRCPAMAAIAGATAGAPAPTKSAQAGLFLAKFVRLQGTILVSDTVGGGGANGGNGDDAAADSFEPLLEELRADLASLLGQSALGDGLLVKLVAVQAFAEAHRPDSSVGVPATVSLVPGGGAAAAPARDPPEAQRRRLRARRATLALGAELCDRVASLLGPKAAAAAAHGAAARKAPGPGGGRIAPAPSPSLASARLLLPLLLVAEHLRGVGESDPVRSARAAAADAPDEAARVVDLSHQFWGRIATVLNLLRAVYPVEDAGPESERLGSLVPREYLSLRGFLPFRGFVPGAGRGGFLDPKEAAEALLEEKRLGGAGAGTQETLSAPAGSVGTGTGSGDAGRRAGSSGSSRVKVARFLRLGRELASDGCPGGVPGFGRAADGTFTFDPAKARERERASPPSPMELDASEFDDDDGGDDVNLCFEEDRPGVAAAAPGGAAPSSSVLVYKRDKAGGPALLVPAALLQNPDGGAPPAPAVSTPAPAPPAAAVPPSPAPTGFGLGWLQDQISAPSLGAAAPAPIGATPSALVDGGESRFAMPQGDLAALEGSAATAPSVRDASPMAGVLPPPGFGSFAGTADLASPAPAHFQGDSIFQHMGHPASFLGAPFGRDAAPPPSLTMLDMSHMLFDDPGATRTANSFVAAPPYYGPPPGGSNVPPFSGPPPSSDALWMMQDVLGGEDYVGTSLLDSGLLHSMLNDDASPQKPASSRNPFAA